MKQWFVVYTQPSKELFAYQQLKAQGFEAYLPRYQRRRFHARKVEMILSPLFPRYLFVSLDLEIDRWRSVNGTRGVSYILTDQDLPIPISGVIIDRLKAQENSEGAIPVNSLALFVKGDKLRIVEGAFEGQTGIFDHMDDKKRIRLLLNFLGRDMKIILPHYTVEAA
jgi:transcriptional antiterminator RfaH